MLTPDSFKDIMAGVAETTTIVTTPATDSVSPMGMTVSAFTSVSADPPIVLVCIDKRSASLDLYLAASGYTVNLMPHGTEDVAMLFATTGADKFGATPISPATDGVGGPVLDAAYGHLECRVIERTEMGDHWVLYGEVVSGTTDADAKTDPLIYLRRGFAEIAHN